MPLDTAARDLRATPPPESVLIAAAIAGDRAAVDELVARLSPVIQARVARLLLARGAGRDLRVQVEDMTQEVFLSLFEDDARVLRSWNPERGLSLENFVGLVARRQAISILRTGAASPFTEDATEETELLRLADGGGDAGLEERVASREAMLRIYDHLQMALSPRSLELWQRLYIDEESVESVMATTGLSADAVYAWRSRLGKLARGVAEKIWGSAGTRSDSSTRPRKPGRAQPVTT